MFRHGPLSIEIFNDPLFAANGMLLRVADTPDCWLIDPGLPPQPDEMQRRLEREHLRPLAIVLTHCHADHIAGVAPLRERLPHLPIWCPRGEQRLLTDAAANLSAGMGLPIVGPPPDRVLVPGEQIQLGPLTWTTIDVSGHSPGGMAFHCPAVGVLIVGDAVFAESIGRTDFPHSDHERLLRNIRDHVLTLPPETMVYPGHGPPATIDDIRKYNGLLRELLGIRS